MLIRDDRGRGKQAPPPMSAVRAMTFTHGENARHFRPDRVLHACPTCSRSHFVTVDECPGPAVTAHERSLVDEADWWARKVA
jgi:hypothetical protein